MIGQHQAASRRLLWSLWSEMGVPGGGRSHRSVVIDPEPLIAVTPHLAEGDNRLLGLAFDWCAAHSAHVSKSRLHGIWKLLPIPAQGRFQDFNAALAKEGVRWNPQSGTPLEIERGRQQVALPLERPALLAFRVRAIAGVSTRAEVLLRLLFVAANGAGAASLTPWGSNRRSVERVLNELADAGQVIIAGTERRRRFRFRSRDSFPELVQARGLEWWNWTLVFELLMRIRELSEATEGLGPKSARVKVASQCEWFEHWAASFGVEPPPRAAGRVDVSTALSDWLSTVADRLARGQAPEQVPVG